MFNIFSPEFFDNPYPIYVKLHQKGVIHKGSAPLPEFEESWYITGFKEAGEALRCPDLIHDQSTITNTKPLAQFSGKSYEFWSQISEWPLILDDPLHRDRRTLLANAFKQNSIHKLEQSVSDISKKLLAQVTEQSEFDVMWDYAFPLSTIVIFHLLGIPAPDIKWFKSQARQIVNMLDFQSKCNDYGPSLTAMNEIKSYVKKCIKSKPPSEGLLGYILNSPIKIDEDLIGNLVLMLLIVGQETSADAIGNGMLTLAQNPEIAEEIRMNPYEIDNCVQEILRYDTSTQFSGIRFAKSEIQIGGTDIAKGDSVIIALGACNRDPRQFENPDNFNIKRIFSGSELVFGQGIHHCLGIHLAKLELKIAIRDLLFALPVTLSINQINRRENTIFRGLNLLKVRY